MSQSLEKEIKTTFRHKNLTECPICRGEFYREELLSGRGRLIAGNLTEELRREYQENKKFGILYPLIYTVIVCPLCFYAAYSDDFPLPIKDVKSRLEVNTVERTERIKTIFPQLDFNDDRTLEHGVASYILAVTCYSFFDKKYAPSLKKAISAIRACWTLEDLAKETGNEVYTNIKDIFYHKASIFYKNAVEYSQTGKEYLEGVKHYGPDIDKNFGYDGMLYMASLLNFKRGFLEEDPEKRAETYIKSKRVISKLFGIGKASKDKPTAILDMARDLFEQINNQLKELSEQLGKQFS
ncbi:MAG: DUF2225 domain-containing protein [Spirochaetota bacterium]|nr:DUF2225 domain-containing protein [Spirochaetota bacterium]